MPLTAEQLKELGIELNEDQVKTLASKFEAELDVRVTDYGSVNDASISYK